MMVDHHDVVEIWMKEVVEAFVFVNGPEQPEEMYSKPCTNFWRS